MMIEDMVKERPAGGGIMLDTFPGDIAVRQDSVNQSVDLIELEELET